MSDKEYIPQVPSLNPALNRINHEIRHTFVMTFAGAVVETTLYLEGTGRFSEDGWPMPYSGKILALSTYDLTTVRINTTTPPVSFDTGDRISLKAIWDDPFFVIHVQINGNNSTFFLSGGGGNTTYTATILLEMNKPYT